MQIELVGGPFDGLKHETKNNIKSIEYPDFSRVIDGNYQKIKYMRSFRQIEGREIFRYESVDNCPRYSSF